MAKARRFLGIQWSVIILLAALAYAPAWAGGWAVVTLAELPGQVTAGQPFVVEFSVRQHGQTLLPGLSPTITAVRPDMGERVQAQAAESKQRGFYEASVTLPAAGSWDWTIDAFGETHTMPPLTVMVGAGLTPAPATSSAAAANPLPWGVGVTALLAAGSLALIWRRQRRRVWLVGAAAALLVCLGTFAWQWSPPTALLAEGEVQTDPAPEHAAAGESVAAIAPQQMGEALFVAKGCIQCHRNSNVTMSMNPDDMRDFIFAPDLTNYQGSPEYLRLWLAGPASVKPKTQMPDLGLSEAEIETLIAFVTAPE